MSNNPPPFEALSLEIEEATEQLKHYLDGEPVTTQAQADDVGLLMDTLRKLEKKADAERMAEQKPAQDQIKASQEKWKPLTATCTTSVKMAKQYLAPWLAKIEQEKREKAEVLRKEADAKLEAARAALKTDDLSAKLEAEEALKDAQRADRAANAAAKDKAQVKGGGKAVGLKTVHDVELTDPTAFGRWLWQNRKEMYLSALTEMANEIGKVQRIKAPGLLLTERKVVV